MDKESTEILYKTDISYLEKDLYKDGFLQVKPFSYFKDIPRNDLMYFFNRHGIYVYPTLELIEWLKKNIVGSAIEIGAGHGTISRTLGIPITDNRMQEWPEIKLYYEACGQPVIKYNDDVERLTAEDAINKYKPDTVIGTFITQLWTPETKDGNAYGVNEIKILQQVKKYILVINLYTHRNKLILIKPHEEYYFDWLITRAKDPSLNRIVIFNK